MSTMSVTLPDPLQRGVERLAALRGRSVDEIFSDALADYLARDAEDPLTLETYGPDVVRYATQHNLVGHATRMLELLRQHFPCGRIEDVEERYDPEVGDDWLSIRMAFTGSAETFDHAYRSFLDEFTREVPWPAASRLRLSYGIAQA